MLTSPSRSPWSRTVRYLKISICNEKTCKVLCFSFIQIEEQEKKIKLASQQPTCTPVFRRFLSRLLKEIQRVGVVCGHFTRYVALNIYFLILDALYQASHAIIMGRKFAEVFKLCLKLFRQSSGSVSSSVPVLMCI